MVNPTYRPDFGRPGTGPVQRLEVDQEVTCFICGSLSERSTFDARLDTLSETAGAGAVSVSYDVSWTVINAWLGCGHQVVRDGTLVQDWRPLGEDVSMHTMAAMAPPHHDGRRCAYHARLGAWTFDFVNECLRTHPDPYSRPAGGAPC